MLSDSEDKVVRSDAEWRTLLTPQQYHVLREKGTERPFTGLLTENHETGNYHCAACGALLFMSGAKFDSGCGWPSFMIPAGSKVGRGARGLEPRHAARRSHLRSLRRPPRPRLPRRSRDPPACATASTPRRSRSSAKASRHAGQRACPGSETQLPRTTKPRPFGTGFLSFRNG